jgi:hypothetical protein
MKKLFLLTGALLLSACSYRPDFMANVDPVPVSSVELAPAPEPVAVTSPEAVPAPVPEPAEANVDGAPAPDKQGEAKDAQ